MADANASIPTVGSGASPGDGETVSEAEWEMLTAHLQINGVDDVPGGPALRPHIDTSTRSVVLDPGGHWIQGRYRKPQAASESFLIPNAGASDTFDRLVMRLDRTAAAVADRMKPVVLAGSPGSTTPPALTRTAAGIYDCKLASWRRRSNGVVDMVVDERRFVGSQVVRWLSGGQPDTAPAGALGVEADTGRVYWRTNANVWALLLEDTGWVALQPAGGNWAKSTQPSTAWRSRKRNGHVTMAGRLERTVNTLQAGAHGSDVKFGVLGQAFWPDQPVYKLIPLSDVTPGFAEVLIDKTGVIYLVSSSIDVPVGMQVGLDLSWEV